jgi:hypothetical protein
MDCELGSACADVVLLFLLIGVVSLCEPAVVLLVGFLL